MTKKRLFMWYAAFAPFVAIALSCLTADLVGEDDLTQLMLAALFCTMPLSIWLVVNVGNPVLGFLLGDIHTSVLVIPFLPNTTQLVAVEVLLAGSGLLLLLVLDADRRRQSGDRSSQCYDQPQQPDHRTEAPSNHPSCT